MKQQIATWLLLCSLATTGIAQENVDSTAVDETPRMVTRATTIGMGQSEAYDTFLSDMVYTGKNIQFNNEVIALAPYGNDRLATQGLFNLELALTYNPTLTGTTMVGYCDYTYSWLYTFRPIDNLKLLAGGGIEAMTGFIYNLRNGNNPATAKASIFLTPSVAAIYTQRIKSYPITLRYQCWMPSLGAYFSPEYQASYYEIFDLGNTDGIVQFGSFHNQFSLQQLVTIDFPCYGNIFRIGYRNSIRTTSVNSIDSHIYSNSFLIGMVFNKIAARQLNQPVRSAFY